MGVIKYGIISKWSVSGLYLQTMRVENHQFSIYTYIYKLQFANVFILNCISWNCKYKTKQTISHIFFFLFILIIFFSGANTILGSRLYILNSRLYLDLFNPIHETYIARLFSSSAFINYIYFYYMLNSKKIYLRNPMRVEIRRGGDFATFGCDVVEPLRN